MWNAENAPFLPPQNGLLWLQVFETLVKNCGDSVHQQIAEKDVLHEMVKIVKKKVSTVIVFLSSSSLLFFVFPLSELFSIDLRSSNSFWFGFICF
jgi:hypothetical protein